MNVISMLGSLGFKFKSRALLGCAANLCALFKFWTVFDEAVSYWNLILTWLLHVHLVFPSNSPVEYSSSNSYNSWTGLKHSVKCWHPWLHFCLFCECLFSQNKEKGRSIPCFAMSKATAFCLSWWCIPLSSLGSPETAFCQALVPWAWLLCLFWLTLA